MDTAQPPFARARLDSLTGIRAIAAFLVFWHHANEHYDGVSSGMVGVSLFYLLSGFVMAWTDRPEDSARDFYIRRLARIAPAYVAAVVLALTFKLFEGNLIARDLAAFTLLQSWVPSPSIYFAASAVFWSLSCEVFFYATFPIIRTLTRRLNTRGLWTLGVAAVCVSFTIATVGSFFPYTRTLQWATVVFPPARLPEFVLGVVLGTLMSRGWRPRVSVALAALLATASVTLAAFVPYSFSRYAVTLIPFALLIVALGSADASGRRLPTQSRILVTLGAWSYCFYLVHLVALELVIGLFVNARLPLPPGVLCGLLTATVTAFTLHRWIETPSDRRLRAMLSPARSPQRANDKEFGPTR
ncbi:acyltransferase family protein [Microbacterium sp. KNMS]